MIGLSVKACAPSNIALIKYMGKTDPVSNLPSNSSISMTLQSLCTYVEMTSLPKSGTNAIEWQNEMPAGIEVPSQFKDFYRTPSLTEKSKLRMTEHIQKVHRSVGSVLSSFNLEMRDRDAPYPWSIRTANTFPSDSGIASSASSFAAMTLGTTLMCVKDVEAFMKTWKNEESLRQALSQLSRQGSGSSCRSFDGSWVLWDQKNVTVLESSLPVMTDFVILISSKAKKVSSSQAHRLVETSPLWQGRKKRVDQRIQALTQAIRQADLGTISQIAWQEFWEMHSLFHTAAEPFSYWEPGTIAALEWFSSLLKESPPPIVTLDAGPNLHVLVPTSIADPWRKRLKDRFGNDSLLEDQQGQGAMPLLS